MPAVARRHPQRTVALALTLALAAATTAIALESDSHPTAGPNPRTRVYTNHTACLLTDAHGTTTATAAAAWAGMQQASKTTAARTSTLPITGTQTLQNAETYLNTLALQGCETIIGTGTLPDQAIQARATAFPHTRFIAITGATTPHPPTNLTLLPDTAPNSITSHIEQALLTDNTSQPTP